MQKTVMMIVMIQGRTRRQVNQGFASGYVTTKANVQYVEMLKRSWLRSESCYKSDDGIGEYVFRIMQDLEMCQLLKCKRCSDSALDLLREYRTNRSSDEKIRNRTPQKLA